MGEPFHKSITTNRSEEVSEIVDRMPTNFGWVVTGIVIFIVFLMGLFGWLIQYPEVLQGQITLSAEQSIVKINSNTTGTLQLLKFKNGDSINAGDKLGMIKNGANLKDIELLDTLLKKIDIQNVSYKKDRNIFPNNLVLGELSLKYFTFLNALYQYLDYTESQPFHTKKEIGKQLVTTQKKLRNDVLIQREILKKRMETSRSINSRDSILLKGKILSKADYERSMLNRIASERDFEAINKDITNSDYLINEANSKLAEIDILRIEKERELKINLFNSYHDLTEIIKEWKHKYLLIAPIFGRLDFINFLQNEDFVQAGQELFTIVPNENEIVGQIFLPEHGAGKVKKNLEVIIKLDNYPFNEYGTLKGKVKTVSLVTNQRTYSSALSTKGSNNQATTVSGYLVLISIPNGLKTNYGTQLDFHFGTTGIAEIITNKRRLIERLFDNLKYRLKES